MMGKEKLPQTRYEYVIDESVPYGIYQFEAVKDGIVNGENWYRYRVTWSSATKRDAVKIFRSDVPI
jgi:hypothetical protein